MSEAFSAAEAYISEYKFCMDHVVTGNGERHFQKGLKLISHWDLRDEIRGLYSDKTDNPAHVFFKQRMIQGIMEKIVYQDVPSAIINNPHLDWNVENNTVSISPIKEKGYEEKLSIDPAICSAKIFAATFAEGISSKCSNCSIVSSSPISKLTVLYPIGILVTAL